MLRCCLFAFSSALSALDEANLLKAQGVTILTIGVGLTDLTELKSVASQPNYVFTSSNFDNLTSLITNVYNTSCEGKILFLLFIFFCSINPFQKYLLLTCIILYKL